MQRHLQSAEMLQERKTLFRDEGKIKTFLARQRRKGFPLLKMSPLRHWRGRGGGKRGLVTPALSLSGWGRRLGNHGHQLYSPCQRCFVTAVGSPAQRRTRAAANSWERQPDGLTDARAILTGHVLLQAKRRPGCHLKGHCAGRGGT